MKIFTFFLLLFVLILPPAKSQNLELMGLINKKLVLIDSTSGTLELYLEISNMPESENLTGLTFNSLKNNFYSIRESTISPSLVSISKAGVYAVIGNFKLNGTQILSVESLAYNSSSNKLYASVSLNGGVANNDFYSESIVEVNINTAECYLVTEINTGAAYPDTDVMTFKNDDLYIYDGIPPGGNTFNLYNVDINNVSSVTSPQLIFSKNGYLPVNDFTATDQNIYFTEKRNLYRFSFFNNSLKIIGATHSSIEYNGELIKGISKINLCNLPTLSLGDDIKTCIKAPIVLDASFLGGTYEW